MDKGFDIKALKGLTQDSRKVEPGCLFAAFSGRRVDGRDYVAQAIKAGAVAVLAQPGTVLEAPGVVLIEDENPRKAFAKMAAEFYEGSQPAYVVAVTGTNGKTSVVEFARQLWESKGVKAAALGTLSGTMTTPNPVLLHKMLAQMAGEGITNLALEASSHGLDQCRLDGVEIRAAAFTNLSRDHLDYHGDMDAYWEAKLRLFSEVLEENGKTVLNADLPEFKVLSSVCKKRKISIIDYGEKASSIRLISSTPLAHGQEVELELFGKKEHFVFPLIGHFQLMNALCALGLVLCENCENIDSYVSALENIKPVLGRLQLVPGHPQGAAIYIDYAHTPDAFESALKALRPHTKGKMVCLFGCGGDRDKGKRSEMGAVADKFADEVIVTDDNPRSEDPALIREEILCAVSRAQEIPDRRDAIIRAVSDLSEGDVLLLAGKGHEQGQIFADHTDPFDDVNEVEKALKRNLR